MNPAELSNINITIVGLGLIGGSMAKAIRKSLKINKLWAVDINENILKEAQASGVIDNGYINPQFPLENSDVVILCIYPINSLKFIKENMKYFKCNAIITDTAGIKNSIVNEVENLIRDDLEFIGGHPMSGKESAGYHFSDDVIFEGAHYILTPSRKISDDSIILIKEMISALGFKSIIEMSPAAHDEAVAYTSQLPHIIACAMMNSADLDNLNCIGGSFKDITRIADINCELWSELLYSNKNNLLNVMQKFMDDMSDIYGLIKNDEKEYLSSFFKKSSLRRKELNK